MGATSRPPARRVRGRTGSASTASARPSDRIVRRRCTGIFVEGYVDGDLVAAVPMHSGTGPSVAVARTEPAAESDAGCAADVLLLGLAGIAIIAVAGVVGALLAARLSRPSSDLRKWASTIARDDAGPPPPTDRASPSSTSSARR